MEWYWYILIGSILIYVIIILLWAIAFIVLEMNKYKGNTMIFNPQVSQENLLSGKDDPRWIVNRDNIVKMICKNGLRMKDVLDVGERSPMTDELERIFNCKLENTTWDLDYHLYTGAFYDTIIFTSVIEHLYNPLTCLDSLFAMLKDDGYVLVQLPQTKYLTTHHYHNIPDSRIRGLFDKARFKVVDYHRYKNPLKFKDCLKGIRPLLRYLKSHTDSWKAGIYILEKKG